MKWFSSLERIRILNVGIRNPTFIFLTRIGIYRERNCFTVFKRFHDREYNCSNFFLYIIDFVVFFFLLKRSELQKANMIYFSWGTHELIFLTREDSNFSLKCYECIIPLFRKHNSIKHIAQTIEVDPMIWLDDWW